MRNIWMAVAVLTLLACSKKEKEYDATGIFEATETVVSAEQSGVLLTFAVNEGDRVEQYREIGLIDTTQLWLKVRQLRATKNVYARQKPDRDAQIAAIQQQLAKAQMEQQRSA